MDETEQAEQTRRDLLDKMPAELMLARSRGEKVWSVEEFSEEFETLGFAAPLVAVRRKSDGEKGTLCFANEPRQYFGWQAHIQD